MQAGIVRIACRRIRAQIGVYVVLPFQRRDDGNKQGDKEQKLIETHLGGHAKQHLTNDAVHRRELVLRRQ